jgi:hypothetical protein
VSGARTYVIPRRTPKARVYRLPDTPVTAPYGASVTRKLLVGLSALGIIVVLTIIFFAYAIKAAIDGEVGM